MATSQNSSSDDYVSSSSGGKGKRKSQVKLSKDEEALMIRMYNLVGQRWSLIAGRIPGRSAEEIKNYWMSRYATGDYRE